MNGPRFNHFWHYVFDLNNLKVTGQVRILANPTKNKRLEVILSEREKIRDDKNKIESVAEADEVTQVFYGETCDCSRKSTCKTTKCLCFKQNSKCNVFCHTEACLFCK